MTFKQPSIWEKETDLPSFSPIDKNVQTDVCVVGGGITGIMTAYELSQIGLRVIVVDAYKVCSGTTGRTTAKITAQHGLIYDQIIQSYGVEHANRYYQSAILGKDNLLKHIKQLEIDVQLEEKTSTVYTEQEENIRKVEDEFRAYEKLKINGSFSTSVDIPIETKAAIHLLDQVQFNPLYYLKSIIKSCMENGVQFYEHSLAVDLEHNEHINVLFDRGHKISCTYVVQATHFPFYDPLGMFTTRLIPERSFVYAGLQSDIQIPGIYINCDHPTRSIRSTSIQDQSGFLLGGEGYVVGKTKGHVNPYEELKQTATELFPQHSHVTEWSAQDYNTMDQIPYIGRLKHKHENIFVATGFKKWGMTTSSTAALLITDLIQGRKNPDEDIYSPSRFNLTTSVPSFVKQNTHVATQLIKGKISAEDSKDFDVNTLQPNEATTLFRNGKKIGVFKDPSHTIHSVDTTCTHLGCEVAWNAFDLTWDCPCHGSRYMYSGEVIEGPAKSPLKKEPL